MRKIGELVKLADVVVEVADARVAASGRNPALDAMTGARERILVLSRDDLADPATTKAWIRAFGERGVEAIGVDARSQQGVARVARALARVSGGGRGTSRAMVVGIPNSGKSSIVNGLLRRSAARTENRAGVTRRLQWFRMAAGVEVLDTPGILVPKIADREAQWMLAICGALPHARYDAEQVADAFHRWLTRRRPHSRVPGLTAFADARGFVRRGGELDYHNAAQAYVRAFNEGVFGRLSFEAPGEAPGDDLQTA